MCEKRRKWLAIVATLVLIGATWSAPASRRSRHQTALRSFALKHDGSPRRGVMLFEQLGCAACHGEAGKGNANAPALTGISSRYDRAEIIRSILEPSAKIAPGFQRVSITTRDGRTIAGRLVSKQGATLVQVQVKGRDRIVLAREKVEELVMLPGSDMPNGLANGLTKEEFSDLVAYLERLE